MIVDDFQIDGIRQELTESLNKAVRYAIALSPKCFKWKMLSLSGPKALLLLQLLIALVTWSTVNVVAVSIDFRLTSLDTNRVSGLEEYLPSFEVVNCRLNLSAILFGEDTGVSSKEMDSFSAVDCDLPSSSLIVRHSFVEPVLLSSVSTNSLHFNFFCAVIALVMSSFICDRAGEVGSSVRSVSRALIIFRISAGTGSVLSLCLPDGIWRDAAFRMMVRKNFSSFWQSEGGGSLLSLSSIS